MPVCLIIEDNEVDRKSMTDTMESLDFETYAVEDSDAAIKFCKKQVPDLFIVDWLLTGKYDGIEFAAALHEMFKQKIRTIVCSSDPIGAKKVAKAVGCDEYLNKPLDRDLLKKKLQKLSLVA